MEKGTLYDEFHEAFWGNGFDVEGLVDAVWRETASAIEQHGILQTPANSHMNIHEKMTILVEEVGEVARACTYDEGSSKSRFEELIQVAAMSLMWAAAEVDNDEDL